jgi:hypothetical protein
MIYLTWLKYGVFSDRTQRPPPHSPELPGESNSDEKTPERNEGEKKKKKKRKKKKEKKLFTKSWRVFWRLPPLHS